MSDYRVTALLTNINVVTVSQKMVGLERMSDYRGVRIQKFPALQANMPV